MKEEDNDMHESDAQWTPAYESIPEYIRECEEKRDRFARILLYIDCAVATATLLYLIYVLI